MFFIQPSALMTKLLIISPVAYTFWNFPTYCLLAIVGLLFIAQVIGELLTSKPVSLSHYEQVREVFNSLPDKITCVPLDFSNWSYRDIQLFAIANGIRGNQKKVKLIQLLQEV